MRPLAAALAAMAALAGCARAPIGPYPGPVPAPGAITAFADHPKAEGGASGAPAFLVPGTTDPGARRLGTIDVPADAESIVVLVYGDNRPGLRLMTTPYGLPAVLGLRHPGPLSLLWGLINVPVLAVQAIVPQLDGPRDLVSAAWTHRYSGGGQGPVLAALAGESPAIAIINTGDVVENGRRGRQWSDFAELHAGLRRRLPLLAAPGNHERLWAPEAASSWNEVMAAPPAPSRYHFAVDLPGGAARFVFLDSELIADPHDRYPDALQDPLADEQIAWADSALAAPVRWRFLVMHHPLVSAGYHGSDWKLDDARPAAERRRTRLLELCRRRRVTAVLAGHEHLYQRLYVRGADGSGFWQITTGGGGSPLHRPSSEARHAARAGKLPDGSTATWGRGRSFYHYCRLVMDPEAGAVALDVRRVRGDGSRSEAVERVDLAAPPPGAMESMP